MCKDSAVTMNLLVEAKETGVLVMTTGRSEYFVKDEERSPELITLSPLDHKVQGCRRCYV